MTKLYWNKNVSILRNRAWKVTGRTGDIFYTNSYQFQFGISYKLIENGLEFSVIIIVTKFNQLYYKVGVTRILTAYDDMLLWTITHLDLSL